ncbi:MAG TPA: 30S ribosomal protein S17 [candidate division WWE3 bacterium]|uniref:Small ribosomal subunit protein uS17 n=1 Tax=candidate division WWE3 bacterium TaxID=2053526 RepID=A0A7V5MH44_UNCKA|nr:30S ribosomal protein S17 [candidate division WWE3 bacterium]
MKKLKGVVVSDKMEKTVSVRVTRLKKHPKYPKYVKRTKKFLADTNNIDVKVGDEVVIAETRPLSKRKSFKVVEVIKK